MNAARQLRARLVVWVVLGCGVVAALHLGKAAIATPLLQADLGVDLAGAGWLTGIFAVLGFMLLWGATQLILTFVMVLTGVDFDSALSAVVASVNDAANSSPNRSS